MTQCNHALTLQDSKPFLNLFYLDPKALVKNLTQYTHPWIRLQIQPLVSKSTNLEAFARNLNQNQTKDVEIVKLD